MSQGDAKARDAGDNTHLVTLFVRVARSRDDPWPDDPTPEDAWAHVEGAHRKTVYQYRYTPPHGYVHAPIGKPRIVRVRLKADGDFALHDLRIETDPYLQLRVEREPCESGIEFLIHNENDHIQVAYYSILVKHRDFVLTCDPMIRNEPRP